MADKKDMEFLLRAGIELMRRNGEPLKRLSDKPYRFAMLNGETVRVRTSQEGALEGYPDQKKAPAKFDIEDRKDKWLLFVTFDSRGEDKKIVAYLIPMREATNALNQANKDWWATHPKSEGNLRWFIYFGGFTPKKQTDHAKVWKKLDGHILPIDNLVNIGESKPILDEIKWRKDTFDIIKGKPPLSPKQLQSIGLLSGGQGSIWRDINRTTAITNDPFGLAISLLHYGKKHADDLHDDSVIYHFPKTNRRGSYDVSETQSIINCYNFSIPLFVISKASENRRKVDFGYITDIDESNSQCLIMFGKNTSKPPEPIIGEKFRLNANRKEQKVSVKHRERDPRFRFSVLSRYGEKCALCDVDIDTMLDAAHIKSVSAGGSDHPENGITLCRNHHRAFDAYLLSINPKSLDVHTSDERVARTITKKSLKAEKNTPAEQALRWHWREYQKKNKP